MMKKMTLLLLLCTVVLSVWAGPVSRQQAQQIATRYLQQICRARGGGIRPHLTLAYEARPKAARNLGIASPLFYVFNQGESEGIVIVAGDDRMKSVIGYADNGHFDRQVLPEGLNWWILAMEETMTRLVKSSEQRLLSVYAASDSLQPSVAPLVKVNWGQGAPYNESCPVDKAHNNTPSLTGCTAVAMAQVLSKWKYPAHGSGQVNYNTLTHKFRQSALLDTIPFQWNAMLASYKGSKVTAEQRKAVAELMHVCGMAVKMDYCAIASGAKLTAEHLEKYLGIDPGCNIVERVYYNRAEWDAMIRKELSAGRPVIYSGYSMSGGHAFVCDGYNAEGLFHINWGWDGSLNGYFALAELNSAVEHAGEPTDAEGSFNLDQDIVLGIQPKVGEGNVPEMQLFYNSLELNGIPSRTQLKASIHMVRADGNGYKGEMVLGLFDADNQYVGRIGYANSIDLPAQYYYREYPVSGAFPAEVADGNYVLRPAIKNKDGKFVPMRGRKGSPYVEGLFVSVKGNTIAVTQPEKVEAELEVRGIKSLSDKVYAGAKNAFEITLHNAGALYNGPITLTRHDGDREVQIFDNNYIVESGEDLVLRVKLQSPEGLDRDTLSIWYASNDGDIWHTNGYEAALAGQVSYQMTVPTAGAPVLTLSDVKIENKLTYLGEPLRVSMTLKNAGGFYGKDIYCFVFPKNGGQSISSVRQQVYIDKDEAQKLHFTIPVNNLVADDYFFMVYYVSANGAYTSISTTYHAFTVQDEGIISVPNVVGLGVHCVQHAFIVPEGLACGVVTAADGEKLTVDYRYAAGAVVPAGTPLVIKAERRKSYVYQVVLSSEEQPEDNLLRATVDEDGYTYAGEGDYAYYRFGADHANTDYGFYRVDEAGSAFRLGRNKSYLALPASWGHPVGYGLSTANDVTGIETLGQSPIAPVIYTLSGVRVKASLSTLPSGLYIVNGKKVYIRQR